MDDTNTPPSSHTISMREALAYCGEMTTNDASRNCASEQRALPRAPTADHCHTDESSLPVIQATVNDMDESIPSIIRECVQRNRPCVLRGCDNQPWFQPARSAWVDPETKSARRDWFLTTMGADTLVPVRHLIPPVSFEASTSEVVTVEHADPTDTLDEQGRATECDTKQMTLRDYITWMDRQKDADEQPPSLYLKDWHLQTWLEQNATLRQSLYEVPPFFPHDVLNAFLRRFTTGDYRFVYWGPPGSYTSLHSDVLNSFSWSYNVVGTKEWTFRVPGCTNTERKVIQEAGDLMFVPSGWKHSVVNLQETISINHNWVTTDNLPHVWDCIATELGAVDVELASSWAIHCFEARENMLRGCIGLDVSSFFFMVLTRGCELWSKCALDASAATETDMEDLVAIRDALVVLMQDERTSIQLPSRLKATLDSEQLGDEAMATANGYLDHVQALFGASRV